MAENVLEFLMIFNAFKVILMRFIYFYMICMQMKIILYISLCFLCILTIKPEVMGKKKTGKWDRCSVNVWKNKNMGKSGIADILLLLYVFQWYFQQKNKWCIKISSLITIKRLGKAMRHGAFIKRR